MYECVERHPCTYHPQELRPASHPQTRGKEHHEDGFENIGQRRAVTYKNGATGADVLQQICVEVADVMQAEGQPTASDELLRRVMMVVELTADNYSSMYQDMEQGRETEIEAITGFLLGKAALHGIAVPVNQGLYQAVKEKR